MSAAKGIQLESSATDIVEIAALRGRVAELGTLGLARGVTFSGLGRVVIASDHIVLSVRPNRWLLLSPPASPGAEVGHWQSACARIAVAVDLSSALTAFELSGPSVREVLARGCRLDLDPQQFPQGSAAATIMAQVSVILVNLGSGMLVLTPSSTARHFREWLGSTARPFGLEP